MKLVKINDNLLVNPDSISFIEQGKDGVMICIDGRMVGIKSQENLTNILKEIYASGDNLWGAQHFKG